jgi:subtilisin family serine protease
MLKVFCFSASSVVLMIAGQAAAGTDYSASWQAQISETATVKTASNGGAGVVVGVVDTGVVAANPEIAGRVSTLSSCAAVTFACPAGATDDDGHGTAVASILAGSFSASAPMSMSGVAPKVTIVAEKVLNASGSGYDSDVANGIMKATQAGAQVINLSLTYLPTAAVVNAVNYAASKGVTIVWAGGNSSAALDGGANSLGFSAAVPSHLILVGSVSPTNTLSSFSNTPGTGSLTIGSAHDSYASLWLMAPGQNIVAPGIQYGAAAYAYWTGTSMSTPEVAGAVALLDATWPVLARNGTTSTVLFKTADSLGAASTFGNGLLDLAKAFQPIGALTVTGVNGAAIPVTTLSGAMLSSGALGALSAIKSQLASYTAFDTYQRNFLVNLSGLIATTSKTPIGPVTAAPPVNTAAVAGGHFMLVGLTSAPAADPAGAPSGDDLTGRHAPDPTYLAYAGDDGGFWAVGQSVSSSLGFAQAAWGVDSPAAQPASGLGVTGALMDLAQGGRSASLGEPLGPFRIAAAWSSSPAPVGSAEASDRNRTDAGVAAIAVTTRLDGRWSLGVTYSSLREDNALLGTIYDGAGPLSLGARHRSQLVGASALVDLGGGRALLAEASEVAADGAGMASGLIRSVSPLRAAAWGVSAIQAGAFVRGDALTVSLRQPLRVVSGAAQLAVTTVDDQGYASTSFTPVGLAPAGHETDLAVGYAAPLGRRASFAGGLSLRSDAENQPAVTAVDVHAGVNLLF